MKFLTLRVAPPGAVHEVFTITVLSTDGSNWILQVRVRLSPSVMTWLGSALMVTVGGGTGEETSDLAHMCSKVRSLTLNCNVS